MKLNKVYNQDCLEAMKQMKDNEFSLAIVDCEYGINADKNAFKNGVKCKKNGFKEHLDKKWDTKPPNKKYFNELFRVSKNQIIWGANYMIEKINKNSSCWIVWDKMQHNFSFADAELAWTSFNTKVKIFQYARGNESGFAPKIKQGFKQGLNIHPTQKPIALYKWLLTNYANEGDKILDTHLGSGSSRIACYDLGFDFVGYELDKDYFELQEKRFEMHVNQKSLFTPEQTRVTI